MDVGHRHDPKFYFKTKEDAEKILRGS